MLRTLLLLLFALPVQYLTAQSVTGAWYGRADVMVQGINNNYLTELILRQKGDEVEGIFGYYFKDTYQSFFIRGSYNKKTREVFIKNMPVLFYKSNTRNGIECPMEFEGMLTINKVSSSLRGYFYSDAKYKYTCPQIRVNFALDEAQKSNHDSLMKHTVTGKKLWQPQEEDFVVTNVATDKPVTITADATSGGKDSSAAVVKTEEDNLMARFSKRQTIYNMDVEVASDSVRVSIYDNGDIDGDTVSIFLNKKPVLIKQELTARALNVYLALDKTADIQEISMFAENLGKIPPNTALMVVSDGVNRYEVYLSSSLLQNATVRLKRKKK